MGNTRPKPEREQSRGGGRRPRINRVVVGLVVLCWAAGAWAGVWTDQATPPPTWRITFSNDGVFNSDNQFTGSGSVSLVSAVYPTLAKVHGTPAFGRPLARFVLPRAPRFGYRESWTFGQAEHTPNALGDSGLITDDFPYVGLLAWTNTYTAFDDRAFYSAQLLLGWVGPAAGGKQVQSAIHSATGTHKPHGWHNQLANEPIVNLYYAAGRKLWRRSHFDLAATVTGALGNYLTYGQTGLVARIGQLPAGFASTPDPLGRGVHFDATRTPTDHGDLYVTLAARGTAVGYSLARQGNLLRTDNAWSERNTLKSEPFIAQLIAGIHYIRPHWGAHFSVWLTTDTVDPHSLTSVSDAHNNFGVLSLDWRFN